MSGAGSPTPTAEELRELRETFEKMPLVLFEEVIHQNVQENIDLLKRVSELLGGKNIMDMTMWFASFVAAGSRKMPLDGRRVLATLLRRGADLVESEMVYQTKEKTG